MKPAFDPATRFLVMVDMRKPRYGIDAPGLVWFFFVSGGAALALLVVVLSTLAVGRILSILLAAILGLACIYLLSMGSFMIYGSRVMKLRDCEALLNLLPWSGSEQVLDIGCGRGLMLVTAAKRLTTGRATGIDLWQQKDQANNSASAALENATIEGVAERVEVQTADMRTLPFADHRFDVITSNWAVHNLEAEADRQTALNEMIRVLKPGGVVIINDISHQAEYANYLRQRGMRDVQLQNKVLRDAVLRLVSFGSFAPSAVMARKAA